MLVVPGSINKQRANFLIDSGASSSFINKVFVDLHQITTQKVDLKRVRLANGQVLMTNLVVQNAVVEVQGRTVRLNLIVLELSNDVILGFDWLSIANPTINFNTKTIQFCSTEKCLENTMQQAPVSFQLKLAQPADSRQHFVSNTNTLTGHSSSSTSELSTLDLLKQVNPSYLNQKVVRQIENDDVLLEVRVFDGNRSKAKSYLDHYLCGVSVEEAMKSVADEIKFLIKKYRELFPDKLPPGIPPKRTVDHQINLKPDTKPFNQHSYRMNQVELTTLRKQLDELLEQRFIEPSLSQYGSPCLFVKKKTGELRLVVDYRKLNQATLKMNYSLPRIDESLEQFKGSKFFSKLDLNSGYFQIRINENDIQKTAFNTRFGSYQFRVLPFGLSGGPSTFMLVMNEVFRDLVDKGVIIYMDDIAVYSKTKNEHLRLLSEVFERLKKNRLFVKLSKCEFMKSSIEFLGHNISDQGVRMLADKVKSINEWPTPRNEKHVASFLGLLGYYRRFIKDFSRVSLPLSELAKEKVKFTWGPDQEESFQKLKQIVTSDQVLVLPDYDKQFVVTTDASGYAVGASLQQMDDETKRLRPIAFFSKKLSEQEMRWAVYEQELYAIVLSLEEWRHYLVGRKFKLITDHQSLIHLKKQQHLTSKQSRWVERLSDFDYEAEYLPGRSNVVADALSRRADYDQRQDLNTIQVSSCNLNDSVLGLIKEAQSRDPFCKSVIDGSLENADRQQMSVENGVVLKFGRTFIPDDRLLRTKLLEIYHDSPLSGHLGYLKTKERISRNCYWYPLEKDVDSWLRSCTICQKNKTSTKKPIGMLKSVDVPNRNWEVIHMDFIGPLPVSGKNKFDTILTVIDRFSKMVHLIPTHQSATAADTARLVFDNVVKYHGVPDSIISDRDTRFTSNFWRELAKVMGIKLRMSSAFHPETDGLCERANRTVIQLLRNDSNLKANNWCENLTAVEMAINNYQQSSTKQSPYYLNFGMHIKLPNQVNSTESSMPSVEHFTKRMSEIMKTAAENMKIAQNKQKEQADKNRRETPNWKVGDSVFVSTKNFKGFNKLKEKFIGPFKIIEKLNNVSFRVELPFKYQVHNVFHSSLLRSSYENNSELFPNRTVTNVQPPIVKSINNDEEDEWEIEKLVDRRRRRNRLEYLVRWKGWSPEYDEWKTVDQLENARQMMRDYDQESRSLVEEVNQVRSYREDVLTAPGRVVESMQCEGRIRKGLGRRCKARTRRSKFCQAHLNTYQNLRITNSKLPDAGLGLFSGDRMINKSQPIIEYTGKVFNKPVRGNYVLEINKKKYINANHSTDIAGFSNDCRPADRRSGLCQVNSKFAMRKGKPSLVSTKPINPRSEIYTSYGKDYWHFYKN
jgi:transcription antitermination factor NusG